MGRVTVFFAWNGPLNGPPSWILGSGTLGPGSWAHVVTLTYGHVMGPDWPTWGTYGSTWAHMGSIWTHMDPYGSKWRQRLRDWRVKIAGFSWVAILVRVLVQAIDNCNTVTDVSYPHEIWGKL